MSGVTSNFLFVLFCFVDKVVQLVGGGLLLTESTPSSYFFFKSEMWTTFRIMSRTLSQINVTMLVKTSHV